VHIPIIIRQELFEEIETVIKSFNPDLAFSELPILKNSPLKAQLHMAYDIPTRFHKVLSRHLREIERTKMCGRIIIVKNKRRIEKCT
jgi:hypothetical protein